jgi:hypothetical protein
LYIFNRLAGYTETEWRIERRSKSPLAIARKKYPRPSVQELLESSSLLNAIVFLIARNPFERLVSGYCNKFLTSDDNFSNKYKVLKDILLRYRNQTYNKTSFSLKYYVQPTFTEFVRYILDESRAGNRLDEHWAPVYSFCNPCQLNFTHIIKFETFDRDTSIILEKANLSQYLPESGTVHENVLNKSVSLVDKYLNELPLELQKEIYELYKIDFGLFGCTVW